MAKFSTVFVCQLCGWKTNKWVGRCSGCDEWDSMTEEKCEPRLTHILPEYDPTRRKNERKQMVATHQREPNFKEE